MTRSASASVGRRVRLAISDLCSTNHAATRAAIAGLTGIKPTVIDYHTKQMVADGVIRRVLNGVFEPLPEEREDRAVSFTVLPSGMCKLEIGDDIIELTMREARHVGLVSSGTNLQFSNS